LGAFTRCVEEVGFDGLVEVDHPVGNDDGSWMTPWTAEVRFPDGTVVRASSLAAREHHARWRDHGLYLEDRWQPTWPARVVAWPDFGLPLDDDDAVDAIRDAFERARAGGRVEVGCAGGLGRTGTVLACMATLAGVDAHEAVGWVRRHYHADAVETPEQERWICDFARGC
jgi:protein-tyrosine phosphatase